MQHVGIEGRKEVMHWFPNLFIQHSDSPCNESDQVSSFRMRQVTQLDIERREKARMGLARLGAHE